MISATPFGGGDNLIIAPNPAVSTTTIFADKQIKNYTIYNVLGREVLRAENANLSQKISLDVSKFIEGMYIVKVIFIDNTSTFSTLIKTN